MKPMEEMNELKKIAPELSKIKKENPYGVPDNYFDDFSARLQMRLDAEKRILPEKENKIIRLLKPAFGLAASIALIFMLVYWPLKMFMPAHESQNAEIAQTTAPEQSPSQLSDNEFQTIVENMDENSFYTLLEEPAIAVDISDEDLENYLTSNISDYEIYLETDY